MQSSKKALTGEDYAKGGAEPATGIGKKHAIETGLSPLATLTRGRKKRWEELTVRSQNRELLDFPNKELEEHAECGHILIGAGRAALIRTKKESGGGGGALEIRRKTDEGG